VQLLLEHGASCEIVNKFGETPLSASTWLSNLASATVLLERGASTEHKDLNGETPIFIAARRSRLDMVRLLLDHGSDASATNKNGQTASQVLLNAPDPSVAHVQGHIIELLNASAHQRSSGFTPDSLPPSVFQLELLLGSRADHRHYQSSPTPQLPDIFTG
jgi:hypothetical protein